MNELLQLIIVLYILIMIFTFLYCIISSDDDDFFKALTRSIFWPIYLIVKIIKVLIEDIKNA